MTLDYRFPETGPPRAQQVAVMLMGEEAFDWIAFSLKLILGVPLCFVPPVVLAGLVIVRNSLPWSYLPAITICISVVFLPLGMWFILHRKKDLNWQSAPAIWVNPIEIFTEPVFVGPKLILSLVDQLTLDEPNQEVRAMAAAIVVQLLDAGHSMSTRSLLLDGRRTPDEVTLAAKYLERRDWVKIPRSRDRVWLNDSIRKELARLR